jgi:hypothetical protein
MKISKIGMETDFRKTGKSEPRVAVILNSY